VDGELLVAADRGRGEEDYRQYDETLDAVVRALVHQHRLRIDYRGLLGEGRTHLFEPYTLLMYRGGLYLLGRSDLADNLVFLAVERIRSVTPTAQHFVYPADYSPEKHSEGIFGIIAGPVTKVELLVMNPETLAYLESRLVHPTQRFRKRRDGKAVLSMTVRGTEELKNWVLGFGPYLQVLKPKELRQQVAELVSAASSLYRDTHDRAR
jgi:proteasome accessory factor B